jgi:hypothetical protein
MEWFKNSKKETSLLADRRVWCTKCGRYRIEECTIRYGNRTSKGVFLGYPTYYRAMVHFDWGWKIVSVHRKYKPALAVLEYYHEHGRLPEKKKGKKRGKK